MSETIKVSAEELSDLLDDLEPVEKSNWRHGHRDTYVFEKDGKHWMVAINVHPEEGWELYDETTCTRVYPHPVMKVEWRTTPCAGSAPEDSP